MAPDEAIVLLEDWSAAATLATQLMTADAEVVGGIPRFAALKVAKTTADVGLDDWIRRLEALTPIRAAFPNSCVEPGGLEGADDTFFGEQWHLENTGQFNGLRGADLEASAAWAIQRGSSSLIVAVIDTGIRVNHHEFIGKLVPGYDFVDEDRNPDSTTFHGTAVAGLLGAARNNGFGVAGISDCSIMPIRAITTFGTDFDIAQAIAFALENSARVISMSIGSGTPPINMPLSDLAISAAAAAGCTIVASAGNSDAFGSADVSWPGRHPETISVGYTNKNDARASLSATGIALDFVAPGAALRTVGPIPDVDGVSVFTGSSAAAPLLAGAASLLLSEQPDLVREELYSLLRKGAEDQVGKPVEDIPGWDPYHGWGRINAARSLQALCGCTGDEDFRGTPPGKLSATGRQWLTLNAGPDHAGAHYIVVGTFSGTSPGLPLGSLHVPLNQDHYFYASSHQPSPLIRGPIGRLDEDGRARAVLALPASLPPVLVGATLHHAYVLLEGGKPVYVSSPVAAEIGG